MPNETRERWWVVHPEGVDSFASEVVARQWTEAVWDEWYPPVGPAPDLITAIQRNPEAFGYDRDDVIVKLTRDEAEALNDALDSQPPDPDDLLSGWDKLRSALTPPQPEEESSRG